MNRLMDRYYIICSKRHGYLAVSFTPALELDFAAPQPLLLPPDTAININVVTPSIRKFDDDYQSSNHGSVLSDRLARVFAGSPDITPYPAAHLSLRSQPIAGSYSVCHIANQLKCFDYQASVCLAADGERIVNIRDHMRIELITQVVLNLEREYDIFMASDAPFSKLPIFHERYLQAVRALAPRGVTLCKLSDYVWNPYGVSLPGTGTAAVK